MQVLISNGSNKFYLAPLAAELSKANVLAGMLTSGWPTKMASLIARPFKRNAAVQRFFNRKEDIPEELLYVSNAAEILFQIGIRLRRISEQTEQHFDLFAFWWYAAYARRVVKRLRPAIYHYRSCYGLGSVIQARRLGIITICDHSIAHPGVLDYMVDNEGRWPNRPETKFASPLLRLMKRDIHQAGHVLVNSDFVKDTCIFAGVPAERVHVVYTGVTEKYLRSLPEFDATQVRRRPGQSMLFAGGIQHRKGVATLAKAFLSLEKPPRLRLVGGRESGIESLVLLQEFLSNNMVESIGVVPWVQLARYMIEAPVFVFPSYCEGSARVVFEAMACGCFVITTPNSGSIVRNMEHGLLVPPGDAEALAAAIQWASNSPEQVAHIGWNNAQLVRAAFRQDQYAEKVLSLYRSLLGRTV